MKEQQVCYHCGIPFKDGEGVVFMCGFMFHPGCDKMHFLLRLNDNELLNKVKKAKEELKRQFPHTMEYI